MNAMPPSRWTQLCEMRATPYLLFGLYVAIALVLVGRHGVWFDESYSLLLVAPHDLGEIARRTAVDGHPPLWYWVLKPWIALFGADIVAVRAQQALFMLGGLVLWYRFLCARFSRPLALIALLLIVTNPMLAHYTVEGRMYGFGVLLVGITLHLLTSRWRWRWYVYWPVAVAMLYTHYFLAFVVAAELLWLLLVRRDHELKVWWIVVYGASIVAAFTPWIPHAAAQTSRIVSTGFWIPPVAPTTVVSYVEHAFLHIPDADAQGWLVFPVLGFLVTFAALLLRAGRERGGYHALLWCVLAVPWACLFILSCKPFTPIFHPRYVLFSLPALLALLAVGVLATPRRWRTASVAILVLGQLVGIGVFWWRGGTDVRQYYAMKKIAHEAQKPIEGQLPAVVATWQFVFFDAKATLPATQQVVILRDTKPVLHSTDAIYFDKPDWYIHDLDEVTSRFVWLLEDRGQPPMPLPAGWQARRGHVRGYARYRLLERVERTDESADDSTPTGATARPTEQASD
jgi:uncharacterized membrane protein